MWACEEEDERKATELKRNGRERGRWMISPVASFLLPINIAKAKQPLSFEAKCTIGRRIGTNRQS